MTSNHHPHTPMSATMQPVPPRLSLLIALSLLGAQAAFAQPYTVDYTYDAQGRLTHAGLSTTYSIAYTYDAAGNLLSAEPGAPVAVEEPNSAGELPTRFALHASYPNPFNPSATIPYDVKEPTRVRLDVFDVLGRRVATLVDSDHSAGRYKIYFHASGLPSGMYVYRVEMGTYRASSTMMLLK